MLYQRVNEIQEFISFNKLNLILVFVRNNSSHFTLNIVKCEKQILPSDPRKILSRYVQY